MSLRRRANRKKRARNTASSSKNNPVLLGITGPTASGKTDLAEALAERLDARLINCDAFQVYRGFDIGTAKPVRRNLYDLIDIRDPWESYGVGEFVLAAANLLKAYFDQRENVIVVGGSGLYFRALFEKYTDLAPQPDPELRYRLNKRLKIEGLDSLVRELQSKAPQVAERTTLLNPIRVVRALERLAAPSERISFEIPDFQIHKWALSVDAESQHRRIAERLDAMLENGFLEEVNRLSEGGVSEEMPAMRAIGYRTMLELARELITLGEAKRDILIESRQFAKRQRTWLRAEPNLRLAEFGDRESNANLILKSI